MTRTHEPRMEPYACRSRGAGPASWQALIGLAAVAVTACGGSPEPPAEPAPPSPSLAYEPRPLIIVTIDTLRADHLGVYGYPRDTSPTIDAFASEAVTFDRAYSTAGTTLPAHVSLFTGLYPLQTGVVMNGSFLEHSGGRPVLLLPEMLKVLGYQTAGYVSASPVKARTGIDAGMDFYDEPGARIPQRPADETTDNALAWLAEQAEAPFFLWVHYFDPHTPHEVAAPYDTRFSDLDEIRGFLAERGHPESQIPKLGPLNDLYDGEIAFTDAQLGRLFEGLRAGGWYDDATIVIASDHGEGLGQHDRLEHGRVYEEILRIPLLIKFPGDFPLHGTRSDELVSLIDVIPTLAGTLGLPLEESALEQIEGRNALDANAAPEYIFAQRTFRERVRVWGPGQKFVLLSRAWKYHLSTEIDDELYDLVADPHELHNAIVTNSVIADTMRRYLEELTQRYGSDTRRFAVREDRSEETLEELRALGYIQ